MRTEKQPKYKRHTDIICIYTGHKRSTMLDHRYRYTEIHNSVMKIYNSCTDFNSFLNESIQSCLQYRSMCFYGVPTTTNHKNSGLNEAAGVQGMIDFQTLIEYCIWYMEICSHNSFVLPHLKYLFLAIDLVWHALRNFAFMNGTVNNPVPFIYTFAIHLHAIKPWRHCHVESLTMWSPFHIMWQFVVSPVPTARTSFILTHWSRDQITATSQTTHSNTLSWMKMFEFL